MESEDLTPDQMAVSLMMNDEEFADFRQQMIMAYGFLQMFSEEEGDLPPFEEWLEAVVEQAVLEAVDADDEPTTEA